MPWIAGFYYTRSTTGHGWDGDYLRIIEIFCNSAKKVGVTPVHICPEGNRRITEHYFDVSASTDRLVYDREIAYKQFITSCGQAILCDPDMVFVHTPPDLYPTAIAKLVHRPNDDAAFNGPRFVTPKFLPVLTNTVKHMSMMKEKYKKWDGDSSAFASAVYRALVDGMRIDLAIEKLYQSRPSLGAPANAYMYHFKGKYGKQEMLDYANAHGL